MESDPILKIASKLLSPSSGSSGTCHSCAGHVGSKLLTAHSAYVLLPDRPAVWPLFYITGWWRANAQSNAMRGHAAFQLGLCTRGHEICTGYSPWDGSSNSQLPGYQQVWPDPGSSVLNTYSPQKGIDT